MFTTTITFALIVSAIFMTLVLIPVICAYIDAINHHNKYQGRDAFADANQCLILWTVALFVVPCIIIFVACAGQTLAGA